MCDDSCDDQGTVQIQSIACHQDESPDQHDKEDHNTDCPEQAQLLADDGKDHIILCLGHDDLLHTLSQAFAEHAARSNRIERLQGLIACVIRVCLRIQPDQDTSSAEAHIVLFRGPDYIHYDPYAPRNPHGCQSNKALVIRAGHKQHSEGDGKDQESGTHVVGDLPQHDSDDPRRHHGHQETPGGLQPPAADQFDDKCRQNNDRHLGHFRGLKRNVICKIQPSLGAVDLSAERNDHYDQGNCYQISGDGQISPPSVWKKRDHSHEDKTHDRKDQLALEVKSRVTVLDSCDIGTCGI